VGNADDRRRIRAAGHQTLFRTINERARELNDCFRIFTEVGDWVCECSDRTCIERLPMTVSEYELLRSSGDRFAVAPGHEVPENEAVVERHEHYVVVASLGAGGALAVARDPRRARWRVSAGS
jgi:hypothetical protein